MPGRTGKDTTTTTRPLSPEIATPVKTIELNRIDDVTERNVSPLTSLDNVEEKSELNSLSLLLANGQPLLTNFEEKYLVDFILKSSHDDIEKVFEEKVSSIFQMNYGSSSSSLFPWNSIWLLDFCLKHFQALAEHDRAQNFFEKLLKKTSTKTNSTIAFKHWQLETLVREHLKNRSQSSQTKKRRMTVRRLAFP